MEWNTNVDDAAVRDNAVDGSIKIITITSRGETIGPSGGTEYTKVPIKGDGSGAECTITTTNDQQVDTITVTKQGSGYTYGSVALEDGGVPTGTKIPTFDVIIPPQGGHGADIYRELGAMNVLIYSRIENDNENPDFITGNQVARVGLVENPQKFDSTALLTADKASALNALRLTGSGYSSATFQADSYLFKQFLLVQQHKEELLIMIKQQVFLKYWQDRTLAGFNTVGTAQTNPTYGYNLKSIYFFSWNRW